MRALLTTAHGGREVLEISHDYPDPMPGDVEVLVRVAFTAVNFHDIFTRRGMPGLKIALPVVTGSDIAGTVEAVGSAAASRWLGKRVLIDPITRGTDKVGMIGETSDGGRAELVAVPESMLIELPPAVSFESAASLPLAYATAHRMMMVRGAVRAAERVLVLGASGGVGVACVQLAKMAGAEVIACASSAAKLARLGELGADHLVDYSETSVADAVRAIYGKPRVTGGGGVDVAVNFTGGDTLPMTQKCVRAGGRILSCGATAGYQLQLDARYWFGFEHALIGSDGWQRDDLHALLGHVAARRLAPVIDRILPLEQAAEGERLLEEREVVGKVLLQPRRGGL